MKNLLNKFKFFFNRFKTKEVSYDKAGISPTKDWNIMIVTSSVAVISLGVVAFYIYNLINKDRFVTIDSVKKETISNINTELLNKIIRDLDQRAYNTEKIKLESIPGDPSI